MEVLRIGRLAVERWRTEGEVFTRIASAPVETVESARPAALTAPLKALWAQPPTTAVTVVIESAWMPVVLLPLGRSVLAPPQLSALLRHRFDDLYGDGEEPVSAWALRVDYRPGDGTAIGFGLPTAIERQLRVLGDELQLRWQTLIPAFAWGQAWRSQRITGWWLWPEQDRVLVARIAHRRIVALNTAVARSDDPATIESLVRAEAVRWGVSSESSRREPICVADWGIRSSAPASAAVPHERLRWTPVGRPVSKARA